MSYLVLARKWRPQLFEEVVGQAHVTRTLVNAIEMNRVAHAFLFAGVRGVGKTSLARIMAKSLNCAEGPTVKPCGACESCKAVSAGTAVDVIEIDGASNNSVDDVRELRETVPYRPAIGRYKIYVIDEVHMLSTSAFNALLKTLEEPPPHVKFIFATTEPQKIPMTILSRCQRYDFRRIPAASIVDRIRKILEVEEIEAEGAALDLIAREAEGSMRDGLSILDQVLAFEQKTITAASVAEILGVVDRRVFHDLSRALLDHDPSKCLEIVRLVDRQGYDIPTFARGFLDHLRNLVVAGVCKTDKTSIDVPAEEVEELSAQAATVPTETLHRLFKHFGEAYETIARSSQPRIMIEASLARMADLGDLVPAASLIERLESLVSRPGNQGSVSSRKAVKKPPVAKREERFEPPPPPEPVPRAPQAKKATAEQVWDSIVEDMQSKKPHLASILEWGVPSQKKEADLLNLSFSKEYSTVAAMAEERKEEIAEILGERMGYRPKIEISVVSSVKTPMGARQRIEAEDRAKQKEREAREHPLVRGTLSEFNGAISDVNLDGGSTEKES